ncbi:60S ribosomal protein L32-1 [Hibiscus syriacus]|uniref:60S ribosomal protein L32-1 n=1 Tax=Hibiscus syriacus TaxID=106335 RepID=A0A6A3CYV5_HIBSY|nr:60S ribosomal protein L32-1 [Hibiscus syriacus]
MSDLRGTKFSEECCRYGTENSDNINENILAKAAAIYGDGRKHVEKEQDDYIMLAARSMIRLFRNTKGHGSLESNDRWCSFGRCSSSCSTLESNEAGIRGPAEISRRQARIREAPITENGAKLHAAEAKMQELKANMAVLGKEASTALAAKTDFTKACSYVEKSNLQSAETKQSVFDI